MLAVVVEAVLRVGRRALKNRAMVALAAVAFVAIFVLGVPFPLIVLGAGLIGLIGARLRPDLFAPPTHGPARRRRRPRWSARWRTASRRWRAPRG